MTQLLLVVKGVKTEIQGNKGTYSGDVNAAGQAHGHGVFTSQWITLKGTFQNNKASGYCHC